MLMGAGYAMLQHTHVSHLLSSSISASRPTMKDISLPTSGDKLS